MRLKRYFMPKFWKIGRKRQFWVTNPIPGPHPKERCLSLQIILRDILNYAETGKEVRQILAGKNVFVDQKPRTEPGFPVGLQDVISIPDFKKHFRVGVNSRGLAPEEIKEDESGVKLCRIEEKRNIKGGLSQLNLHDGRNITVKDAKPYKRLDSILISLPDQKILKHFKFEPGAPAFVIAGNNIGVKGKLKEVNRRTNMLKKSTATIESKERDIQTLLRYIMVGEISGVKAAPRGSKVGK